LKYNSLSIHIFQEAVDFKILYQSLFNNGLKQINASFVFVLSRYHRHPEQKSAVVRISHLSKISSQKAEYRRIGPTTFS